VKLQFRFLLPSSFVLGLLALCSTFVGTTSALGQKMTWKDKAKIFVSCPDSSAEPNNRHCFTFNRTKNQIDGTQLTNVRLADPLTLAITSAVASSKVIFSGTVLRVFTDKDCTKRMWYVVTQTQESSSVLIYNPPDIGTEYCDYATPNPTGTDTKHWVYLVLPVHVVWAEVFGYEVLRGDSFHKLPSTIPATAFTDCNSPGAVATAGPTTAATALTLCDQHFWPASLFYKTGPVYNVLIQPGTGSGAISYTPVIGSGTASYSFDVQVDPTFRVSNSSHFWNGWIGTPFVLEKSGTQSGNLDSLTGALSYELHPEPNGNMIPPRKHLDNLKWSPVNIRAVQFQVRTGVEYAPTTPHDLNTLQSEILKMPVVFTLNKQPSALTLYPLFALEQVQHVATHLANESSGTTREVAGGDASIRWPFGGLNNLFGDKPITTDFSYRYRWLSNPEPTTNWQAAASGTAPTAFLSAESHSYLRASFNAPLSSYVQFKVTVQHGALPPDFHSLGYTLQLGLAFSDPGSAEH
jgi:hypothetical protein